MTRSTTELQRPLSHKAWQQETPPETLKNGAEHATAYAPAQDLFAELFAI